MKDIINSIKVHLHEKSTSPLLGAFSLSWIAWNYKFIFVLLSSLKIHEKFEYIEKHLYPTFADNILIGFIFPFLSAVLFILVYPYPAELVFSYWKKKQRKMNELRQKIEEETLLSLEDSRRIRKQIDELEYKNHEELEAKDNKIKAIQENKEKEREIKDEEISSLKERLSSNKKDFDEQLKQLQSENSKLETRLKLLVNKSDKNNNFNFPINDWKIEDFEKNQEGYLKILSYIKDNGSTTENQIHLALGDSIAGDIDHLLTDLVKATLLQTVIKVKDGRSTLELTHKGLDLLSIYI